MLGVPEHHTAVVASEREFVHELLDDLLRQVTGLTSTVYGLEEIKIGRYTGPSKTWPTPSAMLYNRAFQDILATEDVGLQERGLDFVANTIMPMIKIGTQPDSVQGVLSKDRTNGCPATEPPFRDALVQIHGGQATNLHQPNINVYHNADGIPLILQKGKVRSALALVPMTFVALDTGQQMPAENIHLPAGTLGAVGANAVNQTGKQERGNATFATYLIEGPLKFTPNRLTAWAYEDVLDRLAFAFQSYSSDNIVFDEKRAELVTQTTLDDFRCGATELIAELQ